MAIKEIAPQTLHSRKLSSVDVLDMLADLFMLRGIPGHIRSDNGPEFVAKAVRCWIAAVGAQTAYIEPGSPRENVRTTSTVCSNCSTRRWLSPRAFR